MISKNLYLLLFIRLNSKRLKNKGFMKIGKLKVIEIIIERCLKSISKKNIIITTTNKKIDDKIFNFAKKKNIKIFRGSENDVRKRAIDCCNKFKIKSFIRMNCDRPFMNYKQLTKMIKIFATNKYDIVTNCLSKNKTKGLALEIIKTQSFIGINKQLKKGDKEHIFDYFYRNQLDYKIYNIEQIKNNFKKSLALDSKYDLNNIRNLFKNFNFDYLISTHKVIEFFRRN